MALVVLGALIFVRVRRRQHSRQLRHEKWEQEPTGAHRTAFRGLFPYQEGDELPGEHRQLEARRLVTQFSEPAFSFGVVCGDSGCGKTSLLRSAIQSRLKAVGEEKGFGVFYLSSLRELADDGSQHADATDIASRLRQELEKLRRLAEDAARGRSLILIIDQFEEFFIEYNSPKLRLEIGHFLNGLIKLSPPVRILCALRRDYLADMKDLAPQVPPAAADRNFFEPISLQTLFTLKNFTVEQAARVVKECAERDRVEVEDEFATMLASDLGEGGFVRPPELQIICTALVGNLTTAEYRLAGGARGILSHYIEDAINVSGDPSIGRRVLRALCDFPAHAKRNPRTVADIGEAVGTEGAQALALIRTALRQFEIARLISSEKRGREESAYTLVHDYLVDAVSKATSDVSTRDDEANQLLDYYVAEYRIDHKTRIPYRRLRFLRKYADRKKLADPTARRLLRASITRLAVAASALVALVAITTTLLVGLITTRRVWHQDVVGRHIEGARSSEFFHSAQPKRGLLITGISGPRVENNTMEVWDVKAASLAHSFQADIFNFALPDYLLGYLRDEKVVVALHVPTKREFRTSVPIPFVMTEPNRHALDISVSADGNMIAYRDESGVAENSSMPKLTWVYSLADNKLTGEMLTCGNTTNKDYYVSSDGDYFLATCFGKKVQQPTAFNMHTKEERVLVRAGFQSASSFAFDDRSSRAATLEASVDGRVYLVLWDIRTGQVLDYCDASLKADSDGYPDLTASFTPDGEHLYVKDRVTYLTDNLTHKRFFRLFRTNPLRRVTVVPEREVIRVIWANDNTDKTDLYSEDYQLMLVWPNESGGTYLWKLTEAKPRLIADFTLSKNVDIVPDMSVNNWGIRAIDTSKEKNKVELWDFERGVKLRDLDIPGRFNKVEFTINGNAVSVNIEGGTVLLFRASDGEKITDDIRNIGGIEREIFYDGKCRRAHVWTDEGRVLRYTEGWYLFGRESWFWPAEKCEAQ
ncbi:MAG TPA: NACHT domain-containing protein [Pyrinomonadaceae bacterium]